MKNLFQIAFDLRYSAACQTLTALFVFMLVGSSTAFGQNNAEWERFNSTEGKFNILMPAKPSLQTQDVDTAQGIVKLYFYGAPSGNSFYAATYGDYNIEPKTAGEKKAVLDGVVSGVVNGVNGTLKTEKEITLSGYPGREIVLTAKVNNMDVTAKWHIVLTGTRLYQIGVMYLTQDTEPSDVNKYLKSFALNK